MTEPRKDSAGILIEPGDIVASFPKGGGMEIARVNKVFPSGRVTGKVASTRNKYAYEEGAPDIKTMRTGRRLKPDVAARPHQLGRWYSMDDYEEYEYEDVHKDYSVVGKVHYWTNKQLADIGLLIIKKADGRCLVDLMAEANRDWDAEVPE